MAPMRVHALGLLAFLWTLPGGQIAAPPALPAAVERIADGVELQRISDPSLLSPAGPIAVQALKLDPRAVTLEIAVAADRLPARETVADIAARRKALAAINAGFFVLENGAPAGLLKVRGRVIGFTTRARGAVGFLEQRGRTRLLFDRVRIDRTRRTYEPSLGSSAAEWERARHAVGGAGLLLLNGGVLEDREEERIAEGFDPTRQPSTMIDDHGDPRRGREPSFGSDRAAQGERRDRRPLKKVSADGHHQAAPPHVDAALVHRGRCADHRQRRLRHHRDLPVPRLSGGGPSPLSVDGVPAAAARADLRRARRLRGPPRYAAAVGARRGSGFARGRHLVRRGSRGARLHPRPARRVGHAGPPLLRRLRRQPAGAVQ